MKSFFNNKNIKLNSGRKPEFNQKKKQYDVILLSIKLLVYIQYFSYFC